MPAIYVSVSASSDLIYKNFIHRNFQEGWTLSAEGVIPLIPVVPFQAQKTCEPDEQGWTVVEKPTFTQRGADLQLRRMRDSPLNDTVVQCLNSKVGVVHLFLTSCQWTDPKTVCGRWSCGSPARPVASASFAADSEEWTAESCKFGFCERCYGDCYPVGRCSPSPKKSTGKKKAKELASSASSSSSESSSESE